MQNRLAFTGGRTMNNDLISREAVIDRYYAEWEKQDICDGSEDRKRCKNGW